MSKPPVRQNYRLIFCSSAGWLASEPWDSVLLRIKGSPSGGFCPKDWVTSLDITSINIYKMSRLVLAFSLFSLCSPLVRGWPSLWREFGRFLCAVWVPSLDQNDGPEMFQMVAFLLRLSLCQASQSALSRTIILAQSLRLEQPVIWALIKTNSLYFITDNLLLINLMCHVKHYKQGLLHLLYTGILWD